MPVPRAHELKEYIEFKNVTGPFDASSKTAAGDSVFAAAWARITDTGGAMDVEDMQHPTQIRNFEIWCRYIEGLTGFMEISWGARSLIITGPPQKVMDSKSRLWWCITAQETTEQSL